MVVADSALNGSCGLARNCFTEALSGDVATPMYLVVWRVLLVYGVIWTPMKARI